MAFGKKGFFGKLGEKIVDAFTLKPEVDEELLEELEEIMIMSDIGMDTTEKIVEDLREAVREDRLIRSDAVRGRIEKIVELMMDKGDRLRMSSDYPLIILMIGVNGGGKTTSIAKMANLYKSQGKKVLLAAADTFRAAATEQLDIWAKRVGVDIVKHQEGADPSAVIYDAIEASKARGVDVLICDTAGRLQTKKNLMNELAKMNSVISNGWPEASRETLLILDATTGKNAISQAKEFSEIADITGIVLTKMDGTAKGGIAVTIADEYDLPIKFLGLGEKMDDLAVFDPKDFAESMWRA
ncbi:MAG: signal recognition particle-docking protein FtsY [Clostridiales Family XIII bacterium]|jgi:fused signal recognition particle receptor|nr:signal recognition particle-docking protein FtsY [Clostridiales Family XIII bacterium]